MRPVEEWADLMYQPDHDHSHIVPFGQEYALCGAAALGLSGWYGTGCWEEFEHALLLPTCAECTARVPNDKDKPLVDAHEGEWL